MPRAFCCWFVRSASWTNNYGFLLPKIDPNPDAHGERVVPHFIAESSYRSPRGAAAGRFYFAIAISPSQTQSAAPQRLEISPERGAGDSFGCGLGVETSENAGRLVFTRFLLYCTCWGRLCTAVAAAARTMSSLHRIIPRRKEREGKQRRGKISIWVDRGWKKIR